MERDDRRRAELEAAHRQARRRFAEVQTLLAPELPGLVSAEALVAHLQARMLALPEEPRRELALKIAAALAELESLRDSLTEEAQAVRHELSRLNSHTAALSAYGRSAGVPPAGRHR